MAGRLRSEASAYLRQHAGNPVDWWPFGDQAFEQARLRDVPVFISIGYAACHWCHVMAHESFEDQATADELNEHFVSIKVDREERPDVDAVYMAATQAMTGQGGWPMSVFALPDGRAFYAGTYYPPRPASGMPSFRQVLAAVSEAWTQRRSGVEESATALSEALGRAEDGNRQLLGNLVQVPDGGWTGQLPTYLEQGVRLLAQQEDRQFGGFGDAPKFPPSSVVQFLLRHAASGSSTAGLADGLAGRTLATMAGSALYDQLDGGFARYAVDRQWSVPHFEKMLYDNVQLLRAYAQWAMQSPPGADRELGAAVASETADWMVSRLGMPGGGFASSLDADTVVDGVHHEGATYLWSVAELDDVLGADGAWAAETMNVGARGTVSEMGSPLHPGRRLDSAEQQRWNALKPALLDVRNRRPQPARDDKIVAGWNGLAIAALAETAELLDRPDLLAAAEAAADYLLRVHLDDGGRLARVSHDGAAQGIEGLLEDYAGCAEGFFALYAVAGAERWYRAAEQLVLRTRGLFLRDGVLSDSAARPAQLSAAAGERGAADPLESATPSGANLFAGVLLTYAAYSGSTEHRGLAENLLQYLERAAPKVPRAAGWGMAVAQALLAGPVELAVVGEADTVAELVRAARKAGLPGMAVARGTGGTGRSGGAAGAGGTAGNGETAESVVPLLAGRPAPAEGALAYVCRGMVCRRPVGSVEELVAELAG
ncbi:thioredoxin domain-containing protein [Crystallibacter degradans]|uniref:thioredoxin domain-containing protein n=1 Tax=Crystallibacter degradans TaxID=2726743 RepID=UPI0014746832|nr:thioredoxin domain-containing protein [Arthrobacter sp. SF27]NMR28301.1 thioredoxin domain-containing protein [Arthrobacter sp. SF27]